MPGLDGFALCRELKRDPLLADVPVILISWKEDLLVRMRELASGASGYLRKEASAAQILASVREALRSRGQLEARLAEPGEVRGSLDGTGVVALLRSVRRARPDARITPARRLESVRVRAARWPACAAHPHRQRRQLRAQRGGPAAAAGHQRRPLLGEQRRGAAQAGARGHARRDAGAWCPRAGRAARRLDRRCAGQGRARGARRRRAGCATRAGHAAGARGGRAADAGCGAQGALVARHHRAVAARVHADRHGQARLAARCAGQRRRRPGRRGACRARAAAVDRAGQPDESAPARTGARDLGAAGGAADQHRADEQRCEC